METITIRFNLKTFLTRCVVYHKLSDKTLLKKEFESFFKFYEECDDTMKQTVRRFVINSKISNDFGFILERLNKKYPEFE